GERSDRANRHGADHPVDAHAEERCFVSGAARYPREVTRNAIRTGVLFAIIAAVAFGLTAPIIAWAGKGLGPLTTAALLYAGAALAAGAFQLGRRTGEHRLQRSDARRII